MATKTSAALGRTVLLRQITRTDGKEERCRERGNRRSTQCDERQAKRRLQSDDLELPGGPMYALGCERV
jgi:hypothetical protein